MAKKASPAKKPVKKSAPPKRAAAKPAPANRKPTKKKPTLKKATAPAGKTSPAKQSTAKPAASKKPTAKKPATKPFAKKSKPAKLAAAGYLAALNRWRQSAVAGVRTIVQKPAATTRGLWHQVPAPRKLLQETGAKLRQVKLSRLKDAGKRELQELMHLAARLREISHAPARPASGRTKRK
jgi:hypothetical protein